MVGARGFMKSRDAVGKFWVPIFLSLSEFHKSFFFLYLYAACPPWTNLSLESSPKGFRAAQDNMMITARRVNRLAATFRTACKLIALHLLVVKLIEP
jgi:hypothetical protein